MLVKSQEVLLAVGGNLSGEAELETNLVIALIKEDILIDTLCAFIRAHEKEVLQLLKSGGNTFTLFVTKQKEEEEGV